MHYRLAVCPACTTQDFTAVAGPLKEPFWRLTFQERLDERM